MTKKKLRPGILISLDDLQRIESEIGEMIENTLKETGEEYNWEDWEYKKFQFSTINKQPKCSDTWEIEK
jgi:hypothetical protein